MKTGNKNLPAGLAEALAQMDAAYQQEAEGFPSLEKDWKFVLLGLRSDVVIQVEEALKAEDLTRADLARLLNVSRAHVSKILNEAGNFQLETIAKLSVALERDIALRFIRKTEKVVVESARIPDDAASQYHDLLEELAAEPQVSFNSYQDSPAPPAGQMHTANIIDMPAEHEAA